MNPAGGVAAMIYQASTWILPVVFAVTFHEAAHGFVAQRLGDETAWRLGRVSFNPFKHIDPVGTVLLPALLLLMRSPFLFGYAKPVPVNFRALRNPRRDSILVAAAGPAMNFALAMLAALAFHLLVYLPDAAAPWAAGLAAEVFRVKNAEVIRAVRQVLDGRPPPGPID